MDRLDLRGGNADALDGEPAQRLRDRYHAIRSMRERPLDVTERPGAKRVVIVLGRDQVPAAKLRREGTVDVGMHKMRMHDIGVDRPQESRGEQRIEVAGRFDADGRHAKCAVEVRRVPRRVVQTDEDGLDAAAASAGSSVSRWRSEPPMPAHAMHVRNPHRVRMRRMTASIVAAASNARRKSQATR